MVSKVNKRLYYKQVSIQLFIKYFFVDKLNKVLAEMTVKKGKGNQSVVANALGIKPQTFGNYLRGREIPVSLIQRWKEVYGENLLALVETGFETNVSRETKTSKETATEQVKVMPMDVWHKVLKDSERFDDVLEMNKEEMRNLWRLIHNMRGGNLDSHETK
jgi:hypothetical protein